MVSQSTFKHPRTTTPYTKVWHDEPEEEPSEDEDETLEDLSEVVEVLNDLIAVLKDLNQVLKQSNALLLTATNRQTQPGLSSS